MNTHGIERLIRISLLVELQDINLPATCLFHFLLQFHPTPYCFPFKEWPYLSRFAHKLTPHSKNLYPRRPLFALTECFTSFLFLFVETKASHVTNGRIFIYAFYEML
jgi:hypothetical protein